MPVVAHHLADPEKGSGIAMICTFGDTTDVTWWRELDLPTRPILGWDGRIRAGDPGMDRQSAAPREAYDSLAGETMFSAQEADGRAAGRRRACWRASHVRSPTR